MTDFSDPTRLSKNDPWVTLSEARQQRGPIVAGWLATALSLLCSARFWRARFRATRQLSRPEAPGTGLPSTLNSQYSFGNSPSHTNQV